jgi:hypothetical protein
MGPPDSEFLQKSTHNYIKNVPIWSYPMYYKNAPYISLGAHHNLATLATARKIAMQFMSIASVHYNFTTWTPHNLATLATAGKIAMQFMSIVSVHYN